MQTFTIAINDEIALKTIHDLEEKHFISIVGEEVIDAPALPGKPFGLQEFRNWINYAEQTSTISFEDAKSIWKEKRNQLRKNIK